MILKPSRQRPKNSPNTVPHVCRNFHPSVAIVFKTGISVQLCGCVAVILSVFVRVMASKKRERMGYLGL